MVDSERPKRILFKCKGNICRSPAAEIILRAVRPDWLVLSCATSNNTIGQCIHPDMVRALEMFHYKVPNTRRKVIPQDIMIEHMEYFDEIHDLHHEGLSDPFKTGDFRESMYEIMQYISDVVLAEPEELDISSIIKDLETNIEDKE